MMKESETRCRRVATQLADSFVNLGARSGFSEAGVDAIAAELQGLIAAVKREVNTERALSTLAPISAVYTTSAPEVAPADIADKMLREVNAEENHETRMERVRELSIFMEATRLL
jgi:hypothetical protein